MERRSWPWKKKSSDKASAEKAVAAIESAGASLAAVECPGDQVYQKKPSSVQVSVELYSHLTGLEDQLKSYEVQLMTLEDQNKVLEEKLSTAHSEMIAKECLVKQHAKVAEEAVSGWEKVEEEALALKIHLETVTLSKLSAENRAAHLDGALKECMRQIRTLKEEHELNLNEVVVMKNKQWKKIEDEFLGKINMVEQDLLHSAAENAALSHSLQEHSNMLLKFSEEKSQAESKIELLDNNVDSCEREMNSLKYELNVVSKELEIRNEEKNMSMKTAEVANKHRLDGEKKIAKLEAECQRLRGLVRKKLPGPAALAQMKLEVENLGRDYGEHRVKRSTVKPPGLQFSSLAEFHKDNEFLTEQLMAMEEETMLLKEALAKRDIELHTSRNIYAKTASRLQALELQMQNNIQQKCSSRSNAQNSVEASSSQHASNPPSMTTLSEDGNDDESCGKSNVVDSVKQLELMDDFLEMEKLACLSTESNQSVSVSDSSNHNESESLIHDSLIETSRGRDLEQPHDLVQFTDQASLSAQQLSLEKFQARISMAFESRNIDMGKILEDIKHIVQDTHDIMYKQPNSCVFMETAEVINEELAATISRIHDFVQFLRKEVIADETKSPDAGLKRRIEEFFDMENKVLSREVSIADFIRVLSHVLAESSELGFRDGEDETCSSYFIDKVAIPEDKLIQKDSMGNAYEHISDYISNPEVESNMKLCEEFERIRLEKNNLAVDLSRCCEDLESTKSQLEETEQVLQDVESQLGSALKNNSLAETQLKCMAESYKSLEMHAEELETEVKRLQVETENLEKEVREEKYCHQNALARCQDLEEQIKTWNERCSEANMDMKTKQDRELAAAAEKLAMCQETMLILGRQLNSFRPSLEPTGFPPSQKGDEDEMTDSAASANFQRGGDESPAEVDNVEYCMSETDSNHLPRSPVRSAGPRHRATKSGSSFSSYAPTPEKQSRGFTRFFSSNWRVVR